ncbi:MAG: M56 family metallopeptidase [Terracidiphilus sp.]|nr:M56 family metallopeptidase [Terracidiphilus sp.]
MTHLPVAFPVVFLLQAALRALVAGAAVWAVLRLFRVRNVVAEKAVWCLLLAAALLLPFAPAQMGLSAADAAGRIYALPQNVWSGCIGKLVPHKAVPAAALQQNTSVPTAVPATALQTPSAAVRRKSASTRRNAAATRLSAADDLPIPAVPATDIAAMPTSPSPSPSPLLSQQQNTVRAPHPFSRFLRESVGSRLPAAAGVLYLAIAALLLSRLAFGLFAALRLWRSSQPLPVAGVSVRVSGRLSSPVTVGSCVLLPADCTGWSSEKLRMVLAHESSHVRQGDFYLQMLAALYAALAWPSPLGWWIKRRLCELGEAISDRAGLLEAPNVSSYAQLLLEFAALPRPTVPGVAMARSSHLSSRIERFLNESNFHLSFARSRRALLAVLVVPAALIVSTAVVRVQAATPQQDQAAQAAQAAPPAPVATDLPPAPAAPNDPPPPPPDSSDAGQPAPPPPSGFAPPPPPRGGEPGSGPGFAPGSNGPGSDFDAQGPNSGPHPAAGPHAPIPPVAGRPFQDGVFSAFGPQPWTVVGDDSKPLPGRWPNNEQIAKARKLAHGHFLWFQRDGKSYFIDDPAIVAQFEAADKSREDFRKQIREQSQQMREQGQQLREQDRKMREQMRELASIKVPDLSKEMDDLNKALATLKSKQGTTISQADLGQLERQLGEVQRKLGEVQFQAFAQNGAGFKPDMGKFNEEMRKFSEQMRKFGEQQGKLFRENNDKLRSTIDESLKNGKAHPVE